VRKINLGKKTSILANDVTLAKAQIGEGRQLSSDQAKPHNKTNQISMGEFQTTNKNKKMHVSEFQLSTSF
jgi:hypothetical protein